MGKRGFPFLTFILGSFVGAVVALLYAPTSGEELRTQIRVEADTRLKQASEEWDKALKNMQKSLDETTEEIRAYLEQLSTKTQPEPVEVEVVEEVVDEDSEAAEA